MERSITLNGQKINYELTQKDVKNLNLRIRRDGTVCVSSSRRVPIKQIEAFLKEHADFILNALARYEEQEQINPSKREFNSGDVIKILGEERILNVEHGTKNSVHCNKLSLTLTVKDCSDVELKRRVFEKWEKEQAGLVITEICEAMFPYFKNAVPCFPQIKFRRMTSRWGSCQPTKNILTFNVMLLEAPVECIEYVVAHEFTHFLEANHSKSFYNKLEEIMPDWKARKNKLNGR